MLFSHSDQRPSSGASSMVSFGGSEVDFPDDSMLLAASDAEEWLGSVEDSAPLPSKDPGEARTGLEAELIHVFMKAVEKLGLE